MLRWRLAQEFAKNKRIKAKKILVEIDLILLKIWRGKRNFPSG